MPTTARPRPTGAKSNMRNGSPTISSRMRETMMLGEVPISVISPPSSEPKDIGISRREAGLPVRRAIWKAIGMKIASAPMFFMKADSTVTTLTRTPTCEPVVCHVRGEAAASAVSTMPERPTAALTTRARADDDHDIVAEAGEGLVGRDDAAGDRGEQRHQRHEVVADPSQISSPTMTMTMEKAAIWLKVIENLAGRTYWENLLERTPDFRTGLGGAATCGPA